MQIVEIVCDKIASEVWRSEERIPSVRELGSELEVNPNTVMRAYEWLSEQGMIYNRRGIGFFVGPNALESILMERRTTLLTTELRAIAQKMVQLDISLESVVEQLKRELGEIE